MCDGFLCVAKNITQTPVMKINMLLSYGSLVAFTLITSIAVIKTIGQTYAITVSSKHQTFSKAIRLQTMTAVSRNIFIR
jgi:hypothetical protein